VRPLLYVFDQRGGTSRYVPLRDSSIGESTISAVTIVKYMLLCYHEEQTMEQVGQPAIQQAIEEVVQSMRQLHARGQYILSAPLHPVSTATSVRVRDGKRLVTDGPFAENA
jgi:hypothetical protein